MCGFYQAMPAKRKTSKRKTKKAVETAQELQAAEDVPCSVSHEG